MKPAIFLILLLTTTHSFARQALQQPFKDYQLKGSTTIYNYHEKKWTYTDTADARKASLPASTFKIINLLIALETGVIKDGNVVVKWPGATDTTLYGYRPDIYHDISVKEAFVVSAGWAFIELAKKIGVKRYRRYLKAAGYGNGDALQHWPDFWNFGSFAISPEDQIKFLVKVYENKTPFAKRNTDILKSVMLTEETNQYKIYSKTGWTRDSGIDSGWWTGYIVSKGNVWFFATRITKPLKEQNSNFGVARKEITKNILRQLGAM